jgi:hypothetical protein
MLLQPKLKFFFGWPMRPERFFGYLGIIFILLAIKKQQMSFDEFISRIGLHLLKSKSTSNSGGNAL